MSSSYLYIIAAHPSGPVKLGVSKDPPVRLKKLQTGHPQVLTIYHQEEVSADLAFYLETHLHKDINHHRKRGEWFNLTVTAAICHVKFTLIHYEPSDLIP